MFLHIAALGLLVSATASPNAVAVNHRSCPNNYSNGLDVVKRDPEQDEEYVTSFYKRVRDNRRAMFGRVSTAPDADAVSRRGRAFEHQLDHSLDHYFDHRLSSMKSKTRINSQSSSTATSAAPSISAARSVRGGGAAPRVVAGRMSSRHLHGVAADGSVGEHIHQNSLSTSRKEGRIGDRSKLSHFKRQLRHHVHKRNSLESYPRQSHYHDTFGEDEAAEGDDYPEHHLGLLRVPCSIAINSGEASLGHHYSLRPSYSSQARTAVAAYVDTGAQVTVISAPAARRAGIYHLLDRRYAGRATGVGHCRVLGRIPARQVHFILGEGCHDNDDETVQMDGPALTVLEGTVTGGVDVLLGLDVLQDWEAEIRMGPGKSITVKKSRNRNSIRGDESTVEIPFANPAQRYRTRNGRNDWDECHHLHRSRMPRGEMTEHSISKFDNDDVEDNDEGFSPTASDVESDLDLLDRTGHGFPEGRSGANSKLGQVKMDDYCAIESNTSDDYFKDLEEEEDTFVCRNEDIDLSGL